MTQGQPLSGRSDSLPSEDRITLAREHRLLRRRLGPLRLLARNWYLRRAGLGRASAFRERWRDLPLFARLLRESEVVSELNLEQLAVLAWAATISHRDSLVPARSVGNDFRLMNRRLKKANQALLDVHGVTAARFQTLTPLVEASLSMVSTLSQTVSVLSPQSQRRRVRSQKFLLGGSDVFSYVAKRVLIEMVGLPTNEAEVRAAKMESAVHLHRNIQDSETKALFK